MLLVRQEDWLSPFNNKRANQHQQAKQVQQGLNEQTKILYI